MKIAYSKKRTYNLGNYENVVIEIAAEDEVNSIVETDDECFIRLKTFVDTKLQEQILEVTKNKPEQITHDTVKKLIINIVKNDESKRDIIKQYMLSHFNVNKVLDLNRIDLIKLNNYLITL